MAGASFTLSTTVRNQGAARSDSTTLRYYESTDSTITADDTEVGTDSVFGLAASRSGDESINLTAPSTPGTYYYGTCVDEVAGESDTTNNCSAAVTVTVAGTSAGEPDLVVSTEVSHTSTNTGGTFTLFANLSNQGDSHSTATTLRYYRSTDSTISSTDTEVGTDSVDGLAASIGLARKSIRLTAPSSEGDYYYGACIDAVPGETDTTNNCSTASRLTVNNEVTLKPDLVVDLGGLSGPRWTGESVTLSLAVRNQGSGSSTETTLRYYRSNDATISSSDTQLGTDIVRSLNAAHDYDRLSISLNMPTSPGTYYYGACVDAVTGESDTTNNCSAKRVDVANIADIVFSSAAVDDDTPTEGAEVTLTATIENQGEVATPTINIDKRSSAVSTISPIDASGTLGSIEINRLDPSATREVEWKFTPPPLGSGLPPTRYAAFCIGSYSGAGNCSGWVAYTIQPAPPEPPEPPNLRVSKFSFTHGGMSTGDVNSPKRVPPNGSFSIQFSVVNRGVDVSESTTLRYYRSADSTITTSDMEIGTYSVGSIPGGKSSFSDHFPVSASSVPGTYYYGACADAVPNETDTSDNCSSAFTVTVTAPAANVPGAPTNLTTTANGQTQIDLSWTAPSDDGGAAITGYKIEVSTDNSNWSGLVADTGSTANSYSHIGLSAGSTRYYRVSAINSAGTGPASSVANATTDSPPAATSEVDRAALVALYNATDGQNWRTNRNWLSDASIKRWHGVTTDRNSRVTRLELNGNGLRGVMPAELGDLSELQSLWFQGNWITGRIPTELGNLSKLEELTLSGNDLSGRIPASLGSLSKLERLTLSGNDLSGSIPAELGGLSKLRLLHLGGNQLTGAIPQEVGSLSNLRVMDVGDNQLTGTIPAELGNLSRLAGLDAGGNRLTGSIPEELGSLSNLRALYLYGNQLSGEIPAKLGDLSNLEGLELQLNQLSGEIPGKLGNLSNLRVLTLHSNQLSGEIPAKLGDLSNLAILFLYENQLTGTIPSEIGSLTNLEALALHNNQLSGDLPGTLSNLVNLEAITICDGNPNLVCTITELITEGIPTGVAAVFGASGVIGQVLGGAIGGFASVLGGIIGGLGGLGGLFGF